jgi:hypothetical protein
MKSLTTIKKQIYYGLSYYASNENNADLMII